HLHRRRARRRHADRNLPQRGMTMTHDFDSLGLANFRCHVDGDRVAWLTLDCPGSPVNRLSADVMHELGLALDYFDQTRPAGVVIQSGKEAGFIAGADIDEFAGLDTPAKGMELVSRGWTLFNRLARVAYPTLALIRGHCLGGGLELAPACRYRCPRSCWASSQAGAACNACRG